MEKRITNRTLRGIVEAVIIATVLTVGLSIVTTMFTDQGINWFETAAVWFSFGSTWLCTRQVRFNYIFAIAATALLSYVFWSSNLLGSMALNLYLIPTVIYGFFVWGKDSNTKPVQHVTPKASVLYVLFTALTWLGAFLTIRALGGSMGALDGWLLVGSILAQYLMDRKKLENWIIWALVNIVSIYVYINSGLYLLAAQFVFFLANAIFAWFQWRKSMRAPETAPGVNVQASGVVTPVGGVAA